MGHCYLDRRIIRSLTLNSVTAMRRTPLIVDLVGGGARTIGESVIRHKRRRRQTNSRLNMVKRLRAFDIEYPDTPEGRRIAAAHAWEFPSRRIKVGSKILSV